MSCPCPFLAELPTAKSLAREKLSGKREKGNEVFKALKYLWSIICQNYIKISAFEVLMIQHMYIFHLSKILNSDSKSDKL